MVNVVCKLAAIGLLVVPGLCSAVTFEKTELVADKTQALGGLAFPLIGLDGEREKFVSVRVFAWTQSRNKEVELQSTSDFLVFPQLVRVGENTKRNVRIQLKNDAVLSKGLSFYRIVLEEFDRPDGTDAPESDAAATRVKIKPRVTIPLIIGDSLTATCEEKAPLSVIGAYSIQNGDTSAGPRLALTNVSQRVVVAQAIRWDDSSTPELPTRWYFQPGAEGSIPVPDIAGQGRMDRLHVKYTVIGAGGERAQCVSFVDVPDGVRGVISNLREGRGE